MWQHWLCTATAELCCLFFDSVVVASRTQRVIPLVTVVTLHLQQTQFILSHLLEVSMLRVDVKTANI